MTTASPQALLERARLGDHDHASDPLAGRILDAALEQFLQFGLRRSTVDDVARRAGVARITVYRRFATKDDLVQGVLLREARRTIAEVEATIGALPNAADRVVEGFVLGVQLLRRDRLFQRLMETEPEVILPYLTIDAGPLLSFAQGFVVHHIRRAQAEGDIPPFAPEPLAELVVRVAQSLVLTRETSIPIDDDEAARRFAVQYLIPVIHVRQKATTP
ncbi:MAG: TetR/AcrR family transcriptional regulator [Acidimicrobiales bacterium]